jgi:hypothetical protein
MRSLFSGDAYTNERKICTMKANRRLAVMARAALFSSDKEEIWKRFIH